MDAQYIASSWDQLADSLMGADPSDNTTLENIPRQLLEIAADLVQHGDDERAAELREYATDIQQHFQQPIPAIQERLCQIMDEVDRALQDDRSTTSCTQVTVKPPTLRTPAACGSSALLMLFTDISNDELLVAEQNLALLGGTFQPEILDRIQRAIGGIRDGAIACGATGVVPVAQSIASLVGACIAPAGRLPATLSELLTRTIAVLRHEMSQLRLLVCAEGHAYDPQLAAISLEAEVLRQNLESAAVPAATEPSPVLTAIHSPARGSSAMLMLFTDDAAEYLDRAEQGLMALEEAPDAVTLERVIEALQELQQGAAQCGVSGLASTVQQVLATLSAVQQGRQPITARHFDLLLQATDLLRAELTRLRQQISIADFDYDPRHATLIAELAALEAGNPSCEVAGIEPEVASNPSPSEALASRDILSAMAADPGMLTMFVSEASEHLDAGERQLLILEGNPADTGAINAVFRAFHSLKGTAGFVELHEIVGVAHHAEDLLDKVREGTLPLTGDVLDVALASLDTLKRMVDGVRHCVATGAPFRCDSERETLISRLKAVVSGETTIPSKAGPVSAPIVHPSVQRPPELLAATPTTSDRPVAAVAAPAPPASTAAEIPPRATPNEAVKVDRARLDQLVDLIGELVICESMMFEDAAPHQVDARADERSEANRNQLRKITRELQELGLALRMVPISGVFQKVTRMVRDLSKKLNKAVDLKLEGEETELDKTVVDQMADPLVHIVRNSLDHGIEESTADRVAAGKPERATITLRAFHQSGNVCIEIQDDGRGLNRKRILAKARERGLIGENQQLKDEEICNLVFAAGFSTAAQVTDISGRGVGMDVVRRNIESLRGCVDLTSVEGQGTTLTLRLPLTMGLIDGMIVQAGAERFIVPTSSIVELIRPAPDQLARVQGKGEVLAVRGRNVPVFRLGETFDIAEDETSDRNTIVVVVEDRDRQAGIAVDRILGQQQVVIKSLGELSKSDGLAGCAVLPDGRVGLILDVPGTLSAARRRLPA